MRGWRKRCRRLKFGELGGDAGVVAVEDGDAAFEGEALFASVTGIEVKGVADRFAELFVGMAEDDDVRIFADDLAFDFVVRRFGIDDVVNEKFAAAEFDKFGFFVVDAGVVVAEDSSDGGDVFEVEDEKGQTNIASVDNMIHLCLLKNFLHARVHVPMRVGNDAHFK